ncbi:hypothetical protein [Coleofasciculus sp. G2-EDA-02]
MDLKEPLDIKTNDIRVRSMTFSLDEDINQAGQIFLHDLMGLNS